MSGRHAVGPWIRVIPAAALEQTIGSLLGLAESIRELFAPEPPAVELATAIAGRFPLAAGPIGAPHRRGVVDSAAAGPIPAAAPRHARTTYRAPSGRGYEPYLVVLDEAATFDETALTVFAPRTARSHINAGSYTP